MQIQRTLQIGPHTLEPRDSDMDSVPFFLAGRNMYAVGMISGEVQPIGAEHLVGEMGGIWAHPMKVADGMTTQLVASDGAPVAMQLAETVEHLSHVEWRSRAGEIELQRRDFVVEDQPAFISLLRLRNTGEQPWRGELHIQVWLKFLGCWFGGMTTSEGEYWLDDTVMLGYDRLWQGRWGVACGSINRPHEFRIEPREVGSLATFVFPLELGAGQTSELEFVLAADHQHGHDGARHLHSQVIGSGEKLLQEKVALYEHKMFTGVALQTPDDMVNRSFELAKANLQLLIADYAPYVPTYFLAGIPEYPQLFGCDNEYNTYGAVAAGFADVAKSTLLTLTEYASHACGRVPHEVTTNGRVFNPGNTQETPQLAIASWDYFRWTGDMAFLRRVYPTCREGVMELLPVFWSGIHGVPYPTGDAMVERHGMGPFKLDSVCYLHEAYETLREMALVLDFGEHVEEYEQRMHAIEQRFDKDWWIESEGMYADSLEADLTQKLDGHWTVVLPAQLGLGAPEHRQRSFERIEREWINEWGLVHTRVREERVWTLPTGLAALAAFRCGKPELGVRLLQNIAVTANYGMLGAFKELIPIGLCFVQLWSAGLYVQGLLEGVLGLEPEAHRDRLSIRPNMPRDWPAARLDQLQVGDHIVSLQLAMSSVNVTHHQGREPLEVRFAIPNTGELSSTEPEHVPVFEEREGAIRWAVLRLAPGQQAALEATPAAITARVLGLNKQP